MLEELKESNVLDKIEELTILIEEYDREDRESDIALFSKHDPLKNLKQALAEKLSSSTGKAITECQIEAQEIVSQITQELTKPSVKSRLCASLKLLSSDLSNLSVGVVSSVLATLITGGVITLPLLPAIPGLVTAVSVLVLTRAGIEFFCSDKRESDN
jgi:hypothetical protein